MITIFILASRSDERYITDFWKHLAAARRSLPGVQWVNPLYVEDMLSTNAVVPALPQPYVVIGCLSKTFLSEVFDQPALREMILQADRAMPLLIRSCEWNTFPSPFAKKAPFINEAISEGSSSDALFVRVVSRLRQTLLGL